MKVGIGYGNHADALQLGTEITHQALQHGDIATPGLVLAFASGTLDATAFYTGIRSVVGDNVPIIGGSAIGIITNDHLCYDGATAGIAILEIDDTHVTIAAVSAVDQDEYQAGHRLAMDLATDTAASRLLLMFYDSIKAAPTPSSPPVMNASLPLIAGIESLVPSTIPIVGAGVLGDFDFHHPHQFCGSFVGQQSVVGALFSGTIIPYIKIMHGCTLQDGIYHTITRINGPIIYEIDNQPAVQMIDRIYGDPSWRNQLPVRRLAIGVNYGDKFDDFVEENYVARLIAGVLPQDEGLVLFEPDLAEGTEIQFMLRDGQTMIDSAQHNATKLMQQITDAGHTPRLALYIDCAGRASVVSDTLTEEAAEIQAVMAQYNLPLLGFYSGVEVAPMFGQSRGLDWTGVLLVLAEGDNNDAN